MSAFEKIALNDQMQGTPAGDNERIHILSHGYKRIEERKFFSKLNDSEEVLKWKSL